MTFSRVPTSSNFQVCTDFLQKCGLLHKVNCQGHLNGSEQYQRTIGCGLMDHNNYLIGSVGSVMKSNVVDIKVQLCLPNLLSFWYN
jgi:hypothetical protein